MCKKKILIISRSFYPGISPRSFRTTELVKEFSKCGHEVTLLTHKVENENVYSNFEKDYNITIKDLGKNILPRIKLGKNKYLNLLKRIISRGLSILIEYPDIELVFLVKKALKNETNYDLLISIAVPHTTHWGVALALKKNKRITKVWVADCGDPYMGASNDSFKKLFYFKYIEKWWCNKVDYITIPFDGAIEAYYKEFHFKIKIIPQGFNFNEIVIDEKEYVSNSIPTFAYSGLLIPGVRDPKPLVDYLLSIKIDFKFIFYNKQHLIMDSLINISNGMVEQRDYIERKELIRTLSKMDFLINFNNNVPTQLPSKLIDYYFTKRPVLMIDSYNFDKKIINQFLKKDYSNKYQFDTIDSYRIEKVANQFLNLCR
ncbi:MAG: hypothetical protein KDC67_10475 [Ignavibacteriae bacterium]|nr:hypothetical protein [Ignavibacteriota bacterium]